jgi:DNA-binding NtrC family response regulator
MSKTIVLIDDDRDDLDLLKETIIALQPSAHCISFIYATEAMRVVCEDLVVVPDYFFIDINMPGMTGDKCISILRARNEFKNSVITVLSTSIPKDVSEVLKNLGADYTYQKPSNLHSYKTIIETVLKGKRNFASGENQSTISHPQENIAS